MRLSEKQLLFITIGSAALVSIVLAVLGIFIFRKNLNKVRQEITAVNEQIRAAKEQEKQKQQLEIAIKKLLEKKEAFEKTLPSKDEVTYEKFIDTLSEISKEANVLLKNASPVRSSRRRGASGAQEQLVSFEKISYSLQLEGEFFELIKFVSLLEEYDRFIKVEYFILTPKGIKPDKIKHIMSIKITTYVYTGEET